MEINRIYCEDCLETMKRMTDNFIDLVVTSPPYDNLRDYHGFTFDFESIAKELYRVMKTGGVIVWVVGDATIKGSETGTSFKQTLFFKEVGFNLHDTMIYKKTGCPFPEVNRYYAIFEYMFVLSKGKPKTYNLIKDRENKYSGDKIARKKFGRNQKGEQIQNSAFKIDPNRRRKEFGVRFNIWEITSASEKVEKQGNHPARFPEKLSTDHIISWSNHGDLVYDPFMGSGTTAISAIKTGRNYIGSEISEEYCKIIEERIQKIPLTLPLNFTPPIS